MGFFWKEDDFTMQINHYMTKAYNEYFVTRRKRGDVNGFTNNTSIKAYFYGQEFSTYPDYTINKYLSFLKVRMSNSKITNYFDNE